MAKVTKKNVTRQTVVQADDINFEVSNLKVGFGKGLDHKSVAVQVVLPKTVEGCQMLLSDEQLVADVRRALRIRYQEDTGARDAVAKGMAVTDVQSLVDAWDRESRISKATPKTVLLSEKPKDMNALLAALKSAGINVNVA